MGKQGLQMDIHLEPVLFRLRRQLNTIKNIEQAAESSWVMAPGGERSYPPAHFLEKHLSYNLKTYAPLTIPNEIKRINGGHAIVKPTIAYQLNNAKVLDGFVYKGSYRLKVKVEKEKLSNYWGDVERIDEGALVSSWGSNIYFGHWIHDEIPLVFAANKLGVQPYRTGKERYLHQAGYEKLLNLELSTVSKAIFSKLILFSDSSLNTYRVERLRKLRTLLSSSGNSMGNRYVYISRGVRGGNGRELVNEAELVEKLKLLGFCIIEPEKMTPKEIVEACLGAEVVLGIEGSAMAHAFVSLREKGMMVCLVPEYQFNNPYMDFCSSVGLQYGFIVGRAVPGGFKVDLDDVDAFFSKIRLS